MSSIALPFLAAMKKRIPDFSGMTYDDVDMSGQGFGQTPATLPPQNPQAPPPQPQDPQPDFTIGAPQVPQQAPPNPMQDISQSMAQGAPQMAPETKGHKLLKILLGAGVGAAQGAGQPTFGAGFQGALQLPFMQQYRQNQLAQQEAQTELIKSQSQMVQTPYGPMAAGMAKLLFPAIVRAGATTTAATIGAGARTTAANIAAKAKLDAIGLQTKIMSQKGAKFIPDVDENGQNFYHVFNPLGQELGRADVNVIPSLMTKTSDSVEYKDDGNGNIIALPKRTVNQPVIPGNANAPVQRPSGGTSKTPGGPRVVAPGKPVRMVVGTDSTGRQVSGTPDEMRSAGVDNFTKLDSGEAAKVNTARQMTGPGGLFNLIDKDLAQFKPGELEALGPRWNEFLAGTIGTADPRYVALRTHVNGLLSTALMQAHVGARGGERIMEHFADIANAGKMSLPTLKAALAAERQYVEEKAMRPSKATPSSHSDDPLGILK